MKCTPTVPPGNAWDGFPLQILVGTRMPTLLTSWACFKTTPNGPCRMARHGQHWEGDSFVKGLPEETVKGKTDNHERLIYFDGQRSHFWWKQFGRRRAGAVPEPNQRPEPSALDCPRCGISKRTCPGCAHQGQENLSGPILFGYVSAQTTEKNTSGCKQWSCRRSERFISG